MKNQILIVKRLTPRNNLTKRKEIYKEMKKLLSILLACAMMMSLFCIIPVSAEEIRTWPYVFEDFEDQTSSIYKMWNKSDFGTVVEGGADGSGYAVKYTVPASGGLDLCLVGNSLSNLLETNDRFQVTMDMKLPCEVIGLTELFLHYTKNNNPGFTKDDFVKMESNIRPRLKFDGTVTDWQKATCNEKYIGANVKIDGEMGVTLRLPSIGTAYDVLLDNVEVKIVKEKFVAAVPATRVIYENDFSADMRNIENISADTELSTVSLNTTDNVLEINDSDAAGLAQFQLDLGETLDYNKKYLITYKAKIVSATDNTNLDAPLAYATSQDSRQFWLITGSGNGPRWQLNGVKCDNSWQDCALYLNMTSATEEVYDDGKLVMRWSVRNGAGSDTGIFQIDDLKVYEVGGIWDGGFDIHKALPDSTNFHREVNNEYPNGGNTSSFNSQGWTTNGTENEYIGPDGNAPSQPNLGMLYFTSNDGTCKNSIATYLEPGQSYNFSTFIEPAAADSCGTLKIALEYTYTDGTPANTVELAQAAPTARGWKEYTAEFTTPENMATATLTVTELGTGANTGYFDRNRCLVYRTDSWSFTKKTTVAAPVLTATAEISGDGVVTVEKNASAPAGISLTSIVKLTATKDGVKSYIGSTTNETIAVPESFRTGYELAAEITPVYSNGYIGTTVTVVIPEHIPVITLTQEGGDVTITTDTALVNAKLIFVSYDENGKMVECDIREPINLDANASDVYGSAWTESATTYKAVLWSSDWKPLTTAVVY